MAVTNYITINGKIHGEVTGGVTTGYATDALGSVVATVDSTGNVANSYRFKPYGAILARTRTSADPKNQWVGSWGYRYTGRTECESYVRARHYGHKPSMWITVDPLWPKQPSHTYVINPTTLTDISGLACPQGKCTSWIHDKIEQLNKLNMGFIRLHHGMAKSCYLAKKEVPGFISELEYVYCQALEFCKGTKPSWCRGKGKPISKYVATSPKNVIAWTACCENACGKCVGIMIIGPAWSRQNECIKRCTVEHEYTHVRNCETSMSPASPPSPAGSLKYNEYTECQAFCNDLRCMLKAAHDNHITLPHPINFTKGKDVCGPGFGIKYSP